MADLTIKGFATQLKKAIHNWDDERITVTKKNKYDATLTMIVDGKLVTETVHYRSIHDVQLYGGKLEEYFNTGKWDTNKYYVKYGGTSPAEGDYSRVFVMLPERENQKEILNFLREVEGDKACGIKEVPKGSFTIVPTTIK